MERNRLPLRLALRHAAMITLFIIALTLAGSGNAGASMENTFLYFPSPNLVATPDDRGVDFEDVTFPAEDGTMLHGWLLPGEKNRPLLVFFHGNAGNISHRVDNLAQLRKLGLTIFIFDYRGYGKSEGEASEEGTYQDARGALTWLNANGYATHGKIYFGRSLGAGVALQLALEEPPTGLVLESPFTSVAAMGKKHYPILFTLLGWLLDAEYDNEKKIGNLKVPLLLLHGTADTIIPPAMGKKLYSLAPEPKSLHLINDADHNDDFFFYQDDYWNTWQQFLLQLENDAIKE